ncbi:5'-methylthioadenosine/S-adenosylhomocysteine nucleosidase [Halalkalibacillus sediminis]|uniref:5'-methylthioadenosine/S-adenosylhomocysteine nucleosidase n=1 Tax=Halalkalibacillus sediminis TaxID=2018042 RepID=A0A2I0QXL5_9BACI|nr:5'-methylthioadenosine/adenosylhomocysteine nucleosidase [Halalkalibacillus sediminis]PKR79072.1 5'-methylthioadenosine/S-adenosylhomocysteine nucleosidase [Halalkalibacillus sediminis]
MKYGIIGAMEQEVAWLLKEMVDVEESIVANCKFYEGRIGDQSIVLLQSGIGKVNAALSTTILHERFNPDYVINTGSAGGTDLGLNVGDIVIGEKIVHHDADATAFGYKYGQIPQMPETYASDPKLVERAQNAIQAYNPSIQVTTGWIGTGDSFMADEERVKAVMSLLADIKALEMEAAAIAQVCHQYGTPFLIIRSLSDIAGKESNISFDQFLEKAAENSASFIINMIN